MHFSAASGCLLAALLGVVPALAAQGGTGAAQKVDPAVQQEARSTAAMDQMIRADVNKDGKVTREEVERLDSRLGRRFNAADGDRDGHLTLPEFEKLRDLSQGATGGKSGHGRTGGGAVSPPRR